MNPTSMHRLRRWTALAAVVWAALALLLAVGGQLNARTPLYPPLQTSGTGGIVIVYWLHETAEAAGVEIGERVLAVDGTPVNTWFRQRGWENLEASVPVSYSLVKADGTPHAVALEPVPREETDARMFVPLFGATLVVGIAYLGIGLLVWRLRPNRNESWAFLLFCAVMATQMFGSVHTYDALWGYERMLVNLPFVGATTFHLFTTFPSEPPWMLRLPRVRTLVYALAGLVAFAGVLESVLGASVAGPATASFAFGALGAAAGIAVLTREWWRSRGTPDSARTDIVFLGAVLSFVPVMMALIAQLIIRTSISTSIVLVWFVVFPAVMAYGIARNQLFDIRGAARSSAAYGAATLAITGLFALLITFADAAFSQFNMNANSPFFSVTFLFFAILAFNPLRNRLQSLVDSVFDRDRVGYRTAVREISEAMVSMLSLDEVSDRLLLAVTDTMGVERAMVMILDDDPQQLRPSAWRGDWDEDELELQIAVDHPIGKHLWMRRQELTRLDFDESMDPETREACREVFDQLEVELLVPILFGVDLLGVIAVGRKLSGEALGPDDRQLLRTLANQSAIAIENAKAFDEIAKLNETLEARVEERTHELRETQAQLMQSEKMRSLGQLVAGVAHELNNPIGFVHANLHLIEGYVEKLIRFQKSGESVDKPRAAIGKLLSSSRGGTQRVKDIVQNLRTFSRMDQAEVDDADLNAEIETTLGLVEPHLKGGISLERDFGDLPRVRCLPGQLNQVFMNLLMNARDALEGKGRILVRTRTSEMGVSLFFEDDGPGIPEEVRGRMFDPFFTTKPVGKGTGLGLAITHEIIERHGGRMDVQCPETGGTIFRIDLPLAAQIDPEEFEPVAS